MNDDYSSTEPQSKTSTAESNRRVRIRKPNSRYLGGDFENDTETTSPKHRCTAENLSQARPQWRKQWRRVTPPTIPQNQGNNTVSPVLPTMAPMQPNATVSAAKPQTASKGTPKTASQGQLISE